MFGAEAFKLTEHELTTQKEKSSQAVMQTHNQQLTTLKDLLNNATDPSMIEKIKARIAAKMDELLALC